jgi:hypothetical protein
MTTLIAAAAVGLFAAGAMIGIIGVVSVAIRREERNLTLTSAATGNISQAGRWLNGVYVRAPLRTAAADRVTAAPLPPGPYPGFGRGQGRSAVQQRPAAKAACDVAGLADGRVGGAGVAPMAEALAMVE